MLYWRFKKARSRFCVEFDMCPWIADFVVLNDVWIDGFGKEAIYRTESHEIEIKISKADFLVDFTNKADKHARYAGNNEVENIEKSRYPNLNFPRPNYFSYCAPAPLWEFIRDFIKERGLPYGVFGYDGNIYDDSIFNVVRASPLNNDPCSFTGNVIARMSSDYAKTAAKFARSLKHDSQEAL